MKYLIHTKCDRAYRSFRTVARQAAETTLWAARRRSGELTVVLAGEMALRSLNRRFLGIDSATDVLSFPSGDRDPETGQKYYGDVVVAVPIALRRARRAAKPPVGEVQLLVTHGVLHLLGFDHGGAEERRHMWAMQREILARLKKTAAVTEQSR